MTSTKTVTINPKFGLQEIVFLITDIDQHQRVVTGIQINPNSLLYRLACGTNETWHYDFEIASDKKFI